MRIYGPNLDVLRDKAQEVSKAMGEVSGVTNLKVEQQVLVPQLEVRLRPEAALHFELRHQHLLLTGMLLISLKNQDNLIYVAFMVVDAAVPGGAVSLAGQACCCSSYAWRCYSQ